MGKPHLVLKGGIWRAYPRISTCRNGYLYFGAGWTAKDAISSLESINRLTKDQPFRKFDIFC